mmetsp:Transcript_18267/g.20309  ORF Transcript_18267/g.20309 Transcript_18267/m.20309 type:complete len:371 (-) Transcript_18267:54-1166(-)
MSNKITLVGVGRLGICLALVLEKAGYDVLGIDIIPPYVEKLNNRTFVSREPQVTDMLKECKNFKATSSLEEGLAHSDIIFIMVDTPTGSGDKSYDHSKLSNVLQAINKHKPSGKSFIIGCTVLPGYIHSVGRFLIRDCPDSTLSYNPEFIAQGAIVQGLFKPDMVLIGEGSKAVGDYLEEAYKKMTTNDPIICRMSAESAEITKLSINCFITTKISFANMVGDIADRTPGANKFDILKAVGGDSRIGSKCILPGYGFGGPCFPRDNRALGNYAVSRGVEPLVSQATDNYNKYHAKLMVEAELEKNLDAYVFEDVAYKPGCPVAIIEESQVLEVAKGVAQAGKKVTIKDRSFIIDIVERDFGSMFSYERTD